MFTATGSTRAPSSTPGTPWTPKAILEVIAFNGDGSLTTPTVTVANPFGDTGGVLNPPTGGAPGAYIVNDDCTGRVHFFDANGAMFNIFVEPPRGDTIWMIQTSPSTTSSRARPSACRSVERPRRGRHHAPRLYSGR